MKGKKEDIDLLLERNATAQLAKVDWDGLNAAISNRLDQAVQSKTSTIRLRSVFKVAAGVAVAAAVLIVVVVRTNKPPGLPLEKGRFAAVKFIKATGSASVEIGYAPAKWQVAVDVGAGRKGLATCDVEIIDLNGDLKEKTDRGTWIIISRPRPVFADNGTAKDMRDFICMF